MQFLKILFWCLIAFVAAIFTFGNWNSVPIRLWNGLEALVNLPLLLAVTFLLGFLPAMLVHRLSRWRLRQRLAASERTVALLRANETTVVVETPSAPPPAPPAPEAPPTIPEAA